jgi:uncharacterized protein YndB with AHSA1/START domain
MRAVRRLSEIASPSTVQLRRRLATTPRQAFALWSGDAVASWFLPAGDEWTERPTMEPSTGAGFSLRMSARGEQYSIHGTVVAGEPSERLSLEWSWDSTSPNLGSHAGSMVTVQFVPARGEVDVVITHEGLPSEAVRDAYIRGWRRCLEGMARVVAGYQHEAGAVVTH